MRKEKELFIDMKKVQAASAKASRAFAESLNALNDSIFTYSVKTGIDSVQYVHGSINVVVHKRKKPTIQYQPVHIDPKMKEEEVKAIIDKKKAMYFEAEETALLIKKILFGPKEPKDK